MSLNWKFQRGGEFKPKNPLWGEYGHFLEQHITLACNQYYLQAKAMHDLFGESGWAGED